MKKFLLAMAIYLTAFLSISFAQLGEGDLAPDWTYSDLNGNSWNLYSMLDSGKTVYFDVSAAWCSPCWSFHTSNKLKNLYNQYGPSGTNEIRVFFFEGQTSNTIDQLNGISTPSNACSSNNPTTYYGGCTRGNWVAGTPFPIIDLPSGNTLMSDYKIQAFPTLYVICPNRTIKKISTSLSVAQMYAEKSNCPAPASLANDPALLFYKGTTVTCGSVDIMVTLQNNGVNPLTSCTITATQGGSQVAQTNWTGNLAKYATTIVTVGTATITANANYNISITSADDNSANNSISANVVFKPLSLIPLSQDFENAFMLTGWNVIDGNGDGETWQDAAAYTGGSVGGFGASNNCTVMPFYWSPSNSVDELLTTQYDFTNATSALLTFDVAYAQYSNENDKLEVLVSTNCGSPNPTWTSKYSKQGTALKTADPTTSEFIPTSVQWRTDTVDLTSFVGSSSVALKFKATSKYGNNLYLDNIQIQGDITGKQEVNIISHPVYLYPNPSSGIVYVDHQLTGQVAYIIHNYLGEIVGQGVLTGFKSSMDLSKLENGIYSVKLSSDRGIAVKKITLSR